MKKNYLLIVLLFLSSYLFAQQLPPSIVWQKCLGGSGDDVANSVLRTADNGILVVGSSKSNNGDVTGHHGSVDSTDGWIVKLSASGSVIWQRSLGGSGNDVFYSVMATNDGAYLCMGSTTSNDGDVSGWHGSADIWMVKIDRNGNIIWNKCFGGSKLETAGNIKQNKDGSIYFIGSTASNDGDVSGNHTTSNYTDAWILKLNKDGNIIWQKCIGGSGTDEGYDITETENGSFMIACEIGSQDTEYGTYTINPHALIAKLDSNKVMKWYQVILRTTPMQITNPTGNDYYLNCYSLDYAVCGVSTISAYEIKFTYSPTSTTAPVLSATAGFVYCSYNGKNGAYDPISAQLTSLATSATATGSATGLVNTGGVNNIYALSSGDSVNNTGYHGGYYDGFICGIKQDGVTKSWKKLFGGSGWDFIRSATQINEFEFVVSGGTNSNNGDVSGNHGGYDFWVVKFGQVNNIKGTVFLDYNANGNRDGNEPLADNIIVQSQKGSVKSASSTYNGIFSNSVDTGTYSTSVLTSIPYYTATPVSKTSIFSSYNSYDSLSFALQPIPGKRDYIVNLFSTGPARPGFSTTYRFRYINIGTDTLVNKTIRMIKDSRFQFLSSVPTQTALSGDTITWVINNLSPRDTGFISVQLKAAAPPLLNLGDTILNSVLIDSTGDLTPLNNLSTIRQLVTSSYDPNDKQENSANSFSKKDISNNKYLQYTIRFQNTGNDTAFNVSVKDTLSAKVDWSSIEMVTSSHPYQLTIKNGNQLTWNFNNIQLVDSVHNEPGSHGYIVYRVKPLATLQPGDSIVNSASIYFDFNPAVKTNNQLTVIKQVLPPPPVPVVTGLQSSYCSVSGLQKGKITNFPLAGSGTTVIVKLDTSLLSVATDSTFSFDVSAIAAGAHIIFISFTNSSGANTSQTNINVTAAVTPNVNVSANITTVVNLTDAVIITASNAAGGGTSPKYTFAKDKAITNIVQTESSTATLTIQPNTLTVGANWIYIRMKTSDTCYTSQTNIDSIDIERSTVTGLTDVDFPTQLINVYPNPFAGIINISGLNTGKTYSIVISNAAGQKIYNQQVSNSRNFSINKTGLQTGKYWLSIYDYKKHKLIGTVSVIKE